MTHEEIIQYLANVGIISSVDGKLSPAEAEAIECIRQEIGAAESDLHKALTSVSMQKSRLVPVGRFSDKVRNLEDMIFVSISDGDFAKSEKSEVLSLAKSIQVTQEQVKEILSASKQRVKPKTDTLTCSACRNEIPPNSKFCPKCGEKID